MAIAFISYSVDGDISVTRNESNVLYELANNKKVAWYRLETEDDLMSMHGPLKVKNGKLEVCENESR